MPYFNAMKLHDEINLLVITTLTFLTGYIFITYNPYQDFVCSSLHIVGENALPEPLFIDSWFYSKLTADCEVAPIYTYICWYFMSYICFDIAFIFFFPECTPLAASVTLHHTLVFALGSMCIYLHIEPGIVLGMLVEINSFFMALRNCQRSKVYPSCLSLWKSFTNFCFLTTWVVFRLIFNPVLLVVYNHYLKHPNFGYFYYFLVGSFAMLTVLNYWWSASFVDPSFLIAFGTLLTATVYFY